MPEQFHLDVMVEDVAAAGPQVLALGAAKLHGENVYTDPAGHPFCFKLPTGQDPHASEIVQDRADKLTT
jgi:hypothetical protein